MCGITGLLDGDGGNMALARAMADRLVARGPDDGGLGRKGLLHWHTVGWLSSM